MTVDEPRWTCGSCGRRMRHGNRQDPEPPKGWRWTHGSLACPTCAKRKRDRWKQVEAGRKGTA